MKRGSPCLGRYVTRRLLALPLVILGVSAIIFFLIRLIPGDPARLMAGQEATKQVVEAMRERMGLDQNLAVQFGMFVKDAAQGDLGHSIRSRKPVVEEITERFPHTLRLTIASLGMA